MQYSKDSARYRHCRVQALCSWHLVDKTTNLDSNRNASPHASVHIARAAAPKQHPQLHLLKLALLQAGNLTVVFHQVLLGPDVPDITGEGAVSRSSLVVGPGIAGAHATEPSRLWSHTSLHSLSSWTYIDGQSVESVSITNQSVYGQLNKDWTCVGITQSAAGSSLLSRVVCACWLELDSLGCGAKK